VHAGGARHSRVKSKQFVAYQYDGTVKHSEPLKCAIQGQAPKLDPCGKRLKRLHPRSIHPIVKPDPVTDPVTDPVIFFAV